MTFATRVLLAATAFVTTSLVVPATTAAAQAAGPPPCTAAMVHLHHRFAGAGLGHAGWVLTVVNVTSTDCTVSGYLGVRVLASHDVTAERAKVTRAGYLGGLAGAGALPVVVLRHGGQASALLEGRDFQGSGKACPSSWGISVTLPARESAVRLRFPVGICSSVQIHPLIAGRSGRS